MLTKWIDAKERQPTHWYTVIIWVVGGHLCHNGEAYLDVGCYDNEKKKWFHSGWDYSKNSAEDFEVEVSHWFRPSRPKI